MRSYETLAFFLKIDFTLHSILCNYFRMCRLVELHEAASWKRVKRDYHKNAATNEKKNNSVTY